MQVGDILRMSLIHTDLFDDSMWRMLCKEVLQTNWEHYSYLPFSTRKRFVEIAARKSLLFPPWYSPECKVLFAILNQRRDLIQEFCEKKPKSVKAVCDGLSHEGNIYFNRPMVNFAYSLLGHTVSDRDKAIADFNPHDETFRLNHHEDYARMCSLRGVDNIYMTWAKSVEIKDPKAHFVDAILKGSGKASWFVIYSMTREKEILERMIEEVAEADMLSQTKRIVLRNLYRGNYIDLARKFVTKFSVDLSHSEILYCLADYYLNTGDEKGLYQTLLFFEREHLLRRGRYQSRIFIIELEEIASLLKRNGLVYECHTENSQ
ncbi:Hypothetical protein BQ3484_277 [Cedratvirus A11]|uniref:Uncharacterized protein n=1 Tax=Cedratvirus A11 TaxID=1903266 RepID=A0A1M7XUI3_9VIRU|nr:Hypothetical protein BQ3484_277 [Cedratvirus A11]SHO33345.1 Hypothetical protein BQ3484_277 [Cedratvirus A11]